MRILWHGFAAPWVPSGYGTQTGHWTTYLRDRGHQVAISVCHGLSGTQSSWEGMTVYPAPLSAEVHSLLRHHAADFKPDVTILLADVWATSPASLKRIPGTILAWIPIDTDRHLSLSDMAVLKASKIRPVAMSEHGQRILKSSAGIDAPYVPHAIDTFGAWTPVPDRRAVRRQLGLPEDGFLIGINSNNIDPYRKGYHEQFEAFRIFTEQHGGKDAWLSVHAMARMKGSTDLLTLAQTCGIRDRVLFSDQDRMEAGSFDQPHMRKWCSAMDVGSNCSLGEGFGLAALEFQACGTPVVLSRGTTGPQLVGPGWLVDTQPFWNGTHGAQWHMPLINHLAWTYGQARQYAARRRDAARDFATRYDIQEIGPMWDEVLATL